MREDSGNSEADIGFDSNGNLDTAAIASHCGSANGYVVTWYDQAPGGNDLTQSTAANQAKIYDGAAVLTRNGKPCIRPNDGTDMYQASGLILSSGDQYIFAVMAQTIDLAVLIQEYNVGNQYYFVGENGQTNNPFGISSYNNSPATTPTYRLEGTAQTWATGDRDAVHDALINQQRLVGIEDSSAPDFQGITLGYDASTGVSQYELHELVIYNSDESTNRTGIESDIDTYYGVTTQRLLDTYSGAAAAYSVRKLSQWYTGNCMRIREDSGDTETDIGFDSNGDLDTAAIASHCGSANGYVVTWYDQSGNGNDVTQSTTSNQPQIYNGTATLTDNGKPAMLFAVDHLQAAFTLGSLVTFFGVSKPQWTSGFTYMVDGVTNYDRNMMGPSQSATTWRAYNGNGFAATYTNNAQQLFSLLSNGGSSELRIDGSGTTGTMGTNSMGGVTIGNAATYPAVGAYAGYIQECVWYGSDKSSDFAGIESNINSYFSIF